MGLNRQTLADGLHKFQENTGRRMNYAANVVLGYVQEQLFTTLNYLPFDVARRYLPESPEPFDCHMSLAEIDEEFKVDASTGLGGLVGAIQDTASLGLSVSYLCGDNSNMAHIAAGVVATKIGLNVLSLAAQGVYLRVPKRSRLNLELSAD